MNNYLALLRAKEFLEAYLVTMPRTVWVNQPVDIKTFDPNFDCPIEAPNLKRAELEAFLKELEGL